MASSNKPSNKPGSIDRAIHAGIDRLHSGAWQRKQLQASKNGILAWLKIKPELKLWKDLKPGHVVEFVEWMEAKNYSRATLNNYLNPLRLASRHIQLYENDQWHQVFVRRVLPKQCKRKTMRYLMEDQIKQVIHKAHEMNEFHALTGFWFGAMAGLRMSEILCLSASDVMDNGCLNIVAEKNPYSPRIIPMVEPLAKFAQAWRQMYSRMPLRSIEALSNNMRRVLDECAAETKDDTFKILDPHQATRVTFDNMALRADVETDYLQGYMGHAPTNTQAAHYSDITPGVKDMPRILTAKVEQLRKRVTIKLEKKLTQL